MIYNKHNFQIASLAPGDQRYYLDGIQVTPDYTEVTNGHYLVRVTRPEWAKVEDLPQVPGYKIKKFTKEEKEKKEDHFILPAAAAKEIEKAIPNGKSTMPILSNAWLTGKTNGDHVEFITTDLETARPFLARKVDGKWPNSDAILEGLKDPGLAIGFNPDYMIKILQQFKKMNITAVKLELYGLARAMQLTGKNIDAGQDIKAVLMPCKVPGEKDFDQKEDPEEVQDPAEDQQQPEDPEPKEVPEEEIETEESIKEEESAELHEIEPAMAAVRENEKKNGIEIKFTRKPEKSILEDLKKNGWRWSRYFKVWYNRNTPENHNFAVSL